MTSLDWFIVVIYILIIIVMSFYIGRAQKDQDDYYLGGRRILPWQVGTSMAANQVSAISLIGAPAFIAVKENGGLKWLQYELAIPLAMIVIIVFLVPVLRSTGGITIYRYLEIRFGSSVRFLLSFIFLISRSLATGVALLAASYVTSVCISLPLNETIIIIGIISLFYTALGGIKADIYSDIMQLIILWGSSFVVIGILLSLLGDPITFTDSASERLIVFDVKSTGFGHGNTFALWPMLVGGFFLYISYYGCDQSQAQRLLATKDNRGAQKSLLINGLMRFPLVITYCTAGILLIPFLDKYPEFSEKISSLPPDYLIPYFLNDYVPAGLLGITVAGVFAASMSSLDSAINSLSAATWEDFLIKIFPTLDHLPDKKKIFYSRTVTLFWGAFTITAAVKMAGGSETVIELVNKIGSAFYGPIAGVFVLGFIAKRAGTASAITGLFSGVSVNILLWALFENEVSWMWWNLTGFAAAVIAGIFCSFLIKEKTETGSGEFQFDIKILIKKAPSGFVKALFIWFFFIIVLCLIIDTAL